MRRYTAILLGLVVSACSSAVVPASAQNPPPEPAAGPVRTLDVSAEAAVSRAPDRAVVRLGVETTARTAEAARAGNADAMAGVMAALGGMGIPASSIRTEAIGLSPRYDRGPNTDEPTIVGYQATNHVAVRLDDMDSLGAVVDAAIQAGANRVLGIRFEIADPESAYHEALEQAVAKARAEAETLARALGEPLGPVLHVSTGRAPTPATGGSELMLRAVAETPVNPGEMQVRATVHITYRLGP